LLSHKTKKVAQNIGTLFRQDSTCDCYSVIKSPIIAQIKKRYYSAGLRI
jgi:hypothetical protein